MVGVDRCIRKRVEPTAAVSIMRICAGDKHLLACSAEALQSASVGLCRKCIYYTRSCELNGHAIVELSRVFRTVSTVHH